MERSEPVCAFRVIRGAAAILNPGGNMAPNPALGVFFHWLGGLAAGSFYVPYRGVKGWAWETYWLVGGFFSWLFAPWILALFLTNDLGGILREAPGSSLAWCYIFGLLWGIGGLTFGLTVRYLGMSLGVAVALGYTAAFGTLLPPIFRGEFARDVLGTPSGTVILWGVAVCLTGIVCAGAAGISKERELPEELKRGTIREFNLKRGLLVATLCGIMSACFAFGLAAGDPIKQISIRHGTGSLWQGLPVLVVVLAGGLTTNFIWCVYLNYRNRTGYQYFRRGIKTGRLEAGNGETAAASRNGSTAAASTRALQEAPMGANYALCALAGTTWYLQFFFYSMGETQMGRFRFSSWTLHMASIIIFSTLWGIALKEWRGVSSRTRRLLILTLAVLIGSTIIVGYGNYLGAAG
jgi:L-rhamnose-H+ transport protein